jgi:hypothetical protein
MNLIQKMFGVARFMIVKKDSGEIIAIASDYDKVKDCLIDYFNANCGEHFIAWKPLHYEELSNEDAFVHYYNEILKPQFDIVEYRKK